MNTTYTIKSRQDESFSVYCDGISIIIAEGLSLEEAQKEIDSLESTAGKFVEYCGHILLPESPFKGNRELYFIN